MHDSLMPTGGFSTLFNLFFEIIWGVRNWNGLLIYYLILTVFLTGLMVGRTEFWVAKLKSGIVLASVVLLVHPIVVLIPSAITSFPRHYLESVIPAFTAFLRSFMNTPQLARIMVLALRGWEITLWWNLSACFSLWEDATIIALLLLADSMTRKQPVPRTGTLRTDSLLFTGVTAG